MQADPDATVVVGAASGAPDPDATVLRRTLVRQAAGRVDATVPEPLPGAAARIPVQRNLALPFGERLHEYRIEGVLGQGGFGITYLATDVNLDAKVAIKEYLPQEIAYRAGDRSVSPNASRHRERYRQGLDNFLTEARTLASLRHPNIVRVARFFEAHKTAYMVLEFERGQSFKHWWPQQKQEGGKGERLLVSRLVPLLDGLSVVHAAGYLHRDIKPDNIQVRDDDGALVLLDFGSAAQALSLSDQDSVVVTPGYAPIEQYGVGEQGAWTDLYALGATLYWAVTGDKPPDAEDRAGGTTLKPAVEAARGTWGRAFLEAIDWALQMDPLARPSGIDAWRARLLADHSASLGLKEAMRRADPRQGSRAAASREAALTARLVRGASTVFVPSRWPLAAKLMLAMLFTALTPMLLTGLYNLDGAQQALQHSELHQAELIAHNTAGRIGQLLQSRSRLARTLSSDADLARWLASPDDAMTQALQREVEAFAAANPDIRHLAVADSAGLVRLSSDSALLGRSLGDREPFRVAVTGSSQLTGVVLGAIAGDRPPAGLAGRPAVGDGQGGTTASGQEALVLFFEPVRALPGAQNAPAGGSNGTGAAGAARGPGSPAGGAVSGVVVMSLRASGISAILDQVRHDADLIPFLVDGDGVLVVHPREDLLFRSLMPLAPDAQQRIAADRRFQRERVDSLGETALAAAMLGRREPGHVSYRSAISGVDEIAGFAPVPGSGWTVGVSQTREAFELPLTRLWTHLLASLVLIGLVFAGLALRFARGIVRPLQEITRGADELTAGRFEEAHVDVHSRDELGRLARTFNVMVDVLRQRERELETRR